jgi:AmiR/NasT family two-component response regulator
MFTAKKFFCRFGNKEGTLVHRPKPLFIIIDNEDTAYGEAVANPVLAVVVEPIPSITVLHNIV